MSHSPETKHRQEPTEEATPDVPAEKQKVLDKYYKKSKKSMSTKGIKNKQLRRDKARKIQNQSRKINRK